MTPGDPRSVSYNESYHQVYTNINGLGVGL